VSVGNKIYEIEQGCTSEKPMCSLVKANFI
jgi:hypothetical protein